MDNEEGKKQEEGKGFAGLSAMVSDVDGVLDGTPKNAQKVSSHSAPKQSVGRHPPVKQSQPRPTLQTSQSPTQSSSGSSAGKWLVGIAVVIGFFWLANQTESNSATRPVPSPVISSTSVAPASQSTVVQPQASSNPAESTISVGRNYVLSTVQSRYCLAAKIRLDASEGVLNTRSDSDVDRFNGYVNDYNSRCGEFGYRQGVVKSAQRDVEPHSGQLQADGGSRFLTTTAGAPSSTNATKTAPPAPDLTVQNIQRRLSERGYNAGPADGVVGGKTRTAIQDFQRDSGVASNGVANSALLRQLEVFAQPPNVQDSSFNSIRPISGASQSKSFVSDLKLYCKDGYRKAGDSCEGVKAPSNSFVSGLKWYCKDGYRKVGNSCEGVKAPSNSFVSGLKWYCKDGYRKVGEQCI